MHVDHNSYITLLSILIKHQQKMTTGQNDDMTTCMQLEIMSHI